MIVFSKQWFKKYNKQLCWLANSWIGQFVFKFNKFGHYLDPNKRVTKITPNSVAQYNGLVYKEKTGEKITYKIIKEVVCHNDKCEYCNFHDAEYGEYPDDCKNADCIKGHTIKKTRIKIVTPIYTKLKTPKEEYTEHFFSRNEYALRLQKVFYPIWLLLHTWDMLIANPFKPAWNLGFDTLTVYPDADPESTSVDGHVYRSGVDETLSTIRSSAGTGVSDTNTGCFSYITSSGSTNQFAKLYRVSDFYDTSTLGDSANITNVVKSGYGSAKKNDLGSPDLHFASGNAASNTALASSDYAQANFGTTSFGSIAYADFSLAAYNDVTLNASGRANISKTGISKFSAQLNWDINNNFTGSWASDKTSYLIFFAADNGSNKPKLVVTYTVVSDTGNFFQLF